LEDLMADEAAARAVVDAYVREHFPDAEHISDDRDGHRSTHRWLVTTPTNEVLLHVSREFLRDYTPATIAARLVDWAVADALKSAAPARFVIVTGSGLREEQWPR
jgi:hypothetical protein